LHPIGAGPFRWDALQVKRISDDNKQILIGLRPFEQYARGEPKLSSYVVHAFTDSTAMTQVFSSRQLTAIVPPDSYDADISKQNNLHEYDFILSAANMVFFNTASGVMADAQVRRAVVQGTNVPALQQLLGYPTRPVREAILKGQVGYDASLQQAPYDLAAAKASLDKAGWIAGKAGTRYKDGKPLSVSLIASDTSEHHKLFDGIRPAWQRLGIKLNTSLLASEDFQNSLSAHNYDAVLYGISIGPDPDVFVYWDSSQTDPRSTRLNLSQYKSGTADAALEAGRTRLDPVLRTIKYRPFLQAWQQDAPALGLYQPRYRYLTHQKVYGLNATVLNTGVDRLNNVQDWMVQTSAVTND
jgi:peptide/nickel transport system substrate-binding protein